VNFVRDDAADADGYGGAQYFTYAFNDKFTAKIRAEVWRDGKGFYVVSFADPHDPMRALAGEPVIDPRSVGGGRTTYGALTAGVDIKPAMPKPLTSLTFRPEVRYDRSLSDTRPFNDSTNRDQFTIAMDCLVIF
jgi:hypothetical protein